MAPFTLLTAVRAATSDAHDALERRLGISEAHCQVTDYITLLRSTLAVVEPLERDIARHLWPHFDWWAGVAGGDTPLRAHRLRADLHALGAPPLVAPSPDLPPVATAASAFGAAYVLQGSLLGGATIIRFLQANTSVTSAHTSYFRLYGDGLGAAWQRFVSALETFGASATATEWQATIDAARDTFRAFDTALSVECAA